jgi:hypothetical protein
MGRKFVISWISSSVLMFSISYVWHGIILNDISNLSYPRGIYLFSSSIVYLVVGLTITTIFSAQIIGKIINNLFLRGIILGALIGMVLFMFAMVVGVTFTKSVTINSIAFDLPWQMLEQSLGGLIIASIFSMMYEPHPREWSEEHD